MSPSKATGMDNIPATCRFVKDGASILAHPITHIVNQSLCTGVGGGVRGIPVQRYCLFLVFRSLFSLQIISRSLFWEHSPFTVLSNNYSLFTVLR